MLLRSEQKHKHEVIEGEGHHALWRRQRTVDLDSGEAAADEIMQTTLTYDAKQSNSGIPYNGDKRREHEHELVQKDKAAAAKERRLQL